MKTDGQRLFRGGLVAAAMIGCMGLTQAEPPNPILNFTGLETYQAGGKTWVRHRYDVANKALYPAEMFAAAPDLPPCGTNTRASRSWVDFFDSRGNRLYGFCALDDPMALDKIWFATEQGAIPPSYVYIVIRDRRTNVTYRSNLAETVG